MTESVAVLDSREMDRRLLLKLHHRLLGTLPAEERAAESEQNRLALIFSLAPMALAFLYLTVLSVLLFR